jgi:hypothetical protein
MTIIRMSHFFVELITCRYLSALVLSCVKFSGHAYPQTFTPCNRFVAAALKTIFHTQFEGTPVYIICLCTIFKGQTVPDCLTLEDGIDRLSRNVGNKLPICTA